MKLTIIITAVLLLAACGKREPSYLPRPPVTQTLTHKAYYYIGLNEQRDRVLIKEIMGIDPVITEWCAAFINMILFEFVSSSIFYVWRIYQVGLLPNLKM